MSPRFFDIGVNATDTQFQGIYRSKWKHDSDFELVRQRSVEAGCEHWLITGGDLADAKEALTLSRSHTSWYSTAGVHPTRSNIMASHKAGPAAYLTELRALIIQGQQENKIKAFGEFGLDYDRLDWSPKETQLPVFEAQLELAVELQLPLFLHSRACEEDFLRILTPYNDRLPLRGVIHSFTGSLNEMKQLTQSGWSIGINGCSLKTDENLTVVREIPLDLLMLETDAPWCDIRPSHAGHKYLKLASVPSIPDSKKVERFESGKMVRSRNEPCTIVQVAWIVAQVKGVAYEEVVDRAFENTMKMFG
ncbi:Deoxyribonuclease Tat-D [Taphrina deformans PYCC 5710]|uniref:Deoxyribonuclease Tat-D n=1 Tax=Taphrina deformans (strain PYCC 5710 / ATCC 11124 / CBS 356.35 / IMI 108563 / JCM 9778 / NBRC 8474) TaxID=1097556 RepID=R4XDL7_TAPDE|nr:Deoxyribonuclease Tat-D [Taphrina deformans PYCC 5710]|eukprot:CCG82498.1 Deoxyribonuclease Tat-D [Taphrina deformans PYCC 5710]